MSLRKYFSFSLLATLTLFFVSQAQAATIVPNIFTDPILNPPAQPGDCSLRYAIQAMNLGATFAGCTNTTPGEDFNTNNTILLQPGPYVVTIPGTGEDNNETGDLDIIGSGILDNIKIIGAGSGQTSINASGIPDNDRAIQINDVQNASITGVAIQGGDVSGSGQDGGGIFAATIFLTLQDVLLTDNMAGTGGGISVTCQPTIIDSFIQGNRAILGQGEGDGGGIFLFFSDICGESLIATIGNTDISGNNADDNGGGIYIDDEISLILDNSTVDGNTAGSAGGGIFNDDGVLGITNSTISRNQALAGDGGGIFDEGFYVFLTNTTVSNNSATSPLPQGGGASGGGIATLGGLKGAYNVTIAFNQVDGSGGGVANFNDFDPDTRFDPQIFNTIIANNTAPEGPDCFGGFLTGGFNLIGDIGETGDCTDFDVTGANGDQVGTPGSAIDPLLGDLQLNGGTTETRALALDSPAVDRGNNVEGCRALDQTLFIETVDLGDPLNTGTIEFIDLNIDQRFFTRPIAIRDPNVPRCDVGAFELQTFTVAITKDDGLGGATIEVGDSFTYTIVLTNNGPGDAGNVTLSDPLPPQVSFESLTTSQGSCAAIGDVVSCDLGDVLSGGVVTVTITVTAVAQGTAVNTATVTTSIGDFSATVTTLIGGLFLEGSGLHCNLNPNGLVSGNAIPALILLTVFAGLAFGYARRRVRSH